MSVGPTELLLIALVVFLLFGTRRLGDLGKGIGEGIRNFKRGIADEPEPKKAEDKAPEPPKQLPGRVASPEEPDGGKLQASQEDIQKSDERTPESKVEP
jgi:sec-independent protein translocase protein TatA